MIPLSSQQPRRPLRRALAVVVLATLAAVVWAAVQAWLVARDLQAARGEATAVASELREGNLQGLEPKVDRLREHAGDAARRTDSLTWRALSGLPVVGDDADAVARISGAVDVIAEESLAPLIETGLDPATFAPRNGRVPLGPIEKAAEPLARAAAGFDEARDLLEGADRVGLVDALRKPYDDAMAEVNRGDRAVGAAARAAGLLPGMLGADGPRTYLVIFQNSAEARSLGGMPGIVATLKADRGRLSLGDTIPVGSFGTRKQPVLPLTPEERAIWFDQPGTYFQDAVFIPDFPRASELMAARLAEETGTEVDGVLSVDPAAMSYVVGAAGGVTVDGVTLTSDTFVDELVHRTYLRFPDDRDAEDAFFAAVATTVFDDALDGGIDAQTLGEALSRGVEEGRVLLHSFHEAEQAELAGRRIAGELPVGEDGPLQVGVYVNDSTGSKMSYFLRHDTEVEVDSCTREGAELTGRLVVYSDTPDGVASLPVPVTGSAEYGVPRGVQLDTFLLVGPAGGEISDIRIDGQATDEDLAVYRGRPVAKVPLWLEPQARLEVTWRMTAPRTATDEVVVRVTPQVKQGDQIVTIPLHCS